MQRKVMTARPAARKSGNDKKAKKTVAVASSRKSEPIIQMVERRSSPNLSVELPKKSGALPVPMATFTF
jgi:hypothetical protein